MLPQNSLLHAHKMKLRWLVALSTLPLLGVVTAFGIMPQPEAIPALGRTLSADIALPEVAGAESEKVYWHTDRMQRGDTLNELLRRLEVRDEAAADFLHRATDTASLRQLRPGKVLRAQTSADGSLLSLSYLDNDGNQAAITRQDSHFRVEIQPAPAERRIVVQTAEISSSLYAATDEANLPNSVATQLVEIFGGEIDFHRDLRRGDKFSLLYEQGYVNGEPTRNARILAAEFINRGRILQAFYFQNSEHGGDYFSPDGKSMRKAFLRSPIEFSRISSGFSRARFHPILNRWRAHKGVDYAAPTGTKVRATADGVVRFVGKQGGYGNMVVLDHQGHFQTVYGHLSRFGDVRRGQRVSQGKIIGYVGQTGLASGPHLHYEFKVSGVQRDPLKIALPDGKPVSAEQQTAFMQTAETLQARLSLLRNTRIALLD